GHRRFDKPAMPIRRRKAVVARSLNPSRLLTRRASATMPRKYRGNLEMAEGGGGERTSGGPPAVFVSYASQDATVAAALVEALERHGIVCWIAPRDVKPGAQYADAIVRAIS